MDFNSTMIEKNNNNYSIYSLQYILLSGYVILSWGQYNLHANLLKLMLMYYNLYTPYR